MQKGSHDSLIELLYTFRTNMSDTLKADITSKGMNPVLTDRIMEYANILSVANVTQENLRNQQKNLHGLYQLNRKYF